MGRAEEDEVKRPKAPHIVGEDLARLSEAELLERQALLRAEITRLEQALLARRASRAAAAGFFKA